MIKNNKPKVIVRHHSYQPSKAEIEADISIPTKPELLARAAMQQVFVKDEKLAQLIKK